MAWPGHSRAGCPVRGIPVWGLLPEAVLTVSLETDARLPAGPPARGSGAAGSPGAGRVPSPVRTRQLRLREGRGALKATQLEIPIMTTTKRSV